VSLKLLRRAKDDKALFNTLLERACRLSGARGGVLYGLHGQTLRQVAAWGSPTELVPSLGRHLPEAHALWLAVDSGETDTVSLEWPGREPVAVLAVPLCRTEGETFGLLCCEFPGGEGHTAGIARAADAVEILGAAASEALERRTLALKAERMGERLKQIAELSKHLEALEEPSAIVSEALDVLLALTPFDYGLFYLLEGEVLKPQLLTGAPVPGLAELYERRPLHRSEGIMRALARTKETVHILDYGAWEEGVPEYQDFNLKSVFATPLVDDGEIRGVLELCSFATVAHIEPDVKTLLEAAAKRAARALSRQRFQRELQEVQLKAHEESLQAIGIALEYRDYETRGHTDRVIELSRKFGEALGLDEERKRHLLWGAYLHDIGKVAIPDDVLLKPARLSYSEMQLIKRHVVVGNGMLRNLEFIPEPALQVVMYHHEHWDGSGYPHELRGEAIPLLARMFALIDVYDALISKRPYKEAWSHQDALAEIQSQAGRHFDPRLADVFVSMWN
jgi:putative nucleotidyltransferase with HDIG domain